MAIRKIRISNLWWGISNNENECTILKTNVAPLIATEDKTNAANDKVHVENQNRGLAWSESGTFD